MHWMPRLRLMLARRPWIHWMVVLVLAVGLGLSVAGGVRSLDRQRASWGATITVFTARRDIVPGNRVGEAVTAVDYPAAMVPSSAMRDRPEPDARARQRVATGEILVDADVATTAGPLGLLPATWMALSVDVSDGDSYATGDHVAVLAEGRMVAAQGLVVRVSDSALDIGVPPEDAAAVAQAITEHSAVVALTRD